MKRKPKRTADEVATDYFSQGYTKEQVVEFIRQDFNIGKARAAEVVEKVLKEMSRNDYAVDSRLSVRKRGS